jgi:hypothetical protein
MTLAGHIRLNTSLARDGMFFLGVPLLLCACMTIAGPYAAQIGVARAFLFVAMMSFVPWWIAGLTTHLARRCCGQGWPLWLIAAIGALAAGPIVLAWASGVYVIADALWPSLRQPGELAGIARWQALALSEGRSVVLWVTFVLIFAESLGWRRYAASDAASPAKQNRFQHSGAQWTDADDARLQRLIAEGLPPRDIASRMQRTYGAVRARTAKLGLKNNRA